ncbi:MAG TPA: glutaminyl-peptide cyclotransferase [Blastocatellia bacterium]|nr:glutaminyl-peptide cyclotransferase [Blastocatellia bacterium]
MLNSKTLFSIAISLVFAAFNSGDGAASKAAAQASTQMTVPARVPTYTYEVVNAYPHDTAAFTQGLVFHQGAFYESTGLNGSSSLRHVELETGRVLNHKKLADEYFAEGLALFNGRLYQLTWQTRRGFVYDLDSFNQLRDFNYAGEGWGLTHDNRSLIMSDGTSRIRFLNPDTFEIQRVITVRDSGGDITQLNELEYIKGEIYANIWLTDRIARIDPQSGKVTAWINLSGLLSPEDRSRPVDVLNGIAYDEASDRLFVTGKYWPKVFEIKVIQRRNTIKR